MKLTHDFERIGIPDWDKHRPSIDQASTTELSFGTEV